MEPLSFSPLPTFSGVATGQPATTTIPAGRKVHHVILEVGDTNGITVASGNLLGEVRCMLNSKAQRRPTAIELNALNSIMGSQYALKTSGTAGTAGYRTRIPIYFAEPWRKNPLEVADSAWNLAPEDVGEGLELQVDIKAGLTAPVLSGFYAWEPMVPGTRLGMIQKWLPTTLTASGTGNDFPITRKDYLQSLHLWPTQEGTPKYVSALELKVDGQSRRQLVPTLMNQAWLLGLDMFPDVAAVPRYDLILDADDPTGRWLPAFAKSEISLHADYNASAAGNIQMMQIRVGNPE